MSTICSTMHQRIGFDCTVLLHLRDGENEELRPYQGYQWIFRTKDLTKMRRKVRGFKFADVRIERKKRSRRQS